MRYRWYLLLAFLVPLFVYLHNLRAGFVWDDYVVLTEIKGVVNPFKISTLPWLTGKFFRPVATLSLQIDSLIWDNNATGYHLTNLLIHCLNGLLLFVVFLPLAGEAIALTATLLFSLHPVNTEVVSWVSCRFDLLALFFALLSFLSLKQYISTKRPIALFTMAIFALFSMLSKETGFMLVLLLPAFYYFLNRKTPLTFHLTVIGFFVIIVSALLSLGNRIYIVENSYLQTIIKGLKLGGLFLYKIFNWSLITPYSACLLEGIGNLAVALTLITLTGLIILIAAGYKRKSPLSFFALWIIITVVPGLYVSLSKNYRLPGSDRFLYSVMPAVAFLLVFFLFKYLKKASIAAVSVLIVLSAYSSHKQSSIWHDNYSLWRAASVQCKNQWTYPLLGYALSALEKNPSEAEMLLQKIINGTDSGRLKTLYPAESSLYRLNAIVRLGTFYEKRKKLKGANQLFERALKEFDKLLADYPRITRWELGGINYLIGYHYYLRAVREQRMDYIKTALKQADYAIKYRPTDIKPYLLKTDILLGIKDCKKAFQVISILYKRFGKTQELINSISSFKKICKPQSIKLPSG